MITSEATSTSGAPSLTGTMSRTFQCPNGIRQANYERAPNGHQSHILDKEKGLTFLQALEKYGGRGGNRTPDTGIFNPLLYQLSYPAKVLSRCGCVAGASRA